MLGSREFLLGGKTYYFVFREFISYITMWPHLVWNVSVIYSNLQPDYETQLLTVQFEWNGVLKSVSSMFVGVSPEFEVALYALCFYMGGEDNYIQLGPYPVNIKCYRLGDRIGSVFPIAECWISGSRNRLFSCIAMSYV